VPCRRWATRASLPVGLMYGRNVALHITRTHARTLIPQVLRLMSEGRLRPEAVTTNEAPLEEAPGVLREHVIGDGTKTILTDVHGPGRAGWPTRPTGSAPGGAAGVSSHTVERNAGNSPRDRAGLRWMRSRTSPR